MSNEELYVKLTVRYSPTQIGNAAPIIASMYDILSKDDWVHGRTPSENKYDAEWWSKVTEKEKV